MEQNDKNFNFEIEGEVLVKYMQKNQIEVNVPKNITEIGPKAFEWCDLEKINIPSTVTEISSAAFENCKNLRKINLPPTIEMTIHISGYPILKLKIKKANTEEINTKSANIKPSNLLLKLIIIIIIIAILFSIYI